MGKKAKKDKEKLTRKPIPEERELPKIPFKVFSQIAGIKWDQLAGFFSYMKRKGVEKATVVEWKALYEEYKVKPVK